MRLVEWTDEQGYKHLSFLRDSDPDKVAPQGIPYDPPNLDQLDWESVKREIHNELVSRRLIKWDDVKVSQDGVTNVVRSVLTRRILMLYRAMDGG
jgi:hypothetical protein